MLVIKIVAAVIIAVVVFMVGDSDDRIFPRVTKAILIALVYTTAALIVIRLVRWAWA